MQYAIHVHAYPTKRRTVTTHFWKQSKELKPFNKSEYHASDPIHACVYILHACVTTRQKRLRI